MGEQEFYRDKKVLISNSRAFINGITYAMSNITSVSALEIKKSKTVPILMIIVGILSLMGELYGFGITIALVGIILFLLTRSSFVVRICTAGLEQDVLVSKNREYILKIVSAINGAIIHRG